MKRTSETTTLSPYSCSAIYSLGDLHYREKDDEECNAIIQEIIALRKKTSKMEDSVFLQLGDLCHSNTLNTFEQYRLTGMAHDIACNFKYRLIIDGNHDKYKDGLSITSFLQYLGFQHWSDDTIWHSPQGDILLGHYFTEGSSSAFGKYRYSMNEMRAKNFDIGLLGHQHDYECLIRNEAQTLIHQGSARYVSFAERHPKKYFGLIRNSELKLIEIKSVIPMYDRVASLEALRSIPKKAKVRYFFNSYEQLVKEIDEVTKLEPTFHLFKKYLNFTQEKKVITIDNKKHNLHKWVETIKDERIKKLILESLEEELIEHTSN